MRRVRQPRWPCCLVGWICYSSICDTAWPAADVVVPALGTRRLGARVMWQLQGALAAADRRWPWQHSNVSDKTHTELGAAQWAASRPRHSKCKSGAQRQSLCARRTGAQPWKVETGASTTGNSPACERRAGSHPLSSLSPTPKNALARSQVCASEAAALLVTSRLYGQPLEAPLLEAAWLRGRAGAAAAARACGFVSRLRCLVGPCPALSLRSALPPSCRPRAAPAPKLSPTARPGPR